jgi:hypothetical protein
MYEVASESFRTVTVVAASVKADKRGGQGHTSPSLLPTASVSHVTPHCGLILFLHKCFFDFVFRLV